MKIKIKPNRIFWCLESEVPVFLKNHRILGTTRRMFTDFRVHVFGECILVSGNRPYSGESRHPVFALRRFESRALRIESKQDKTLLWWKFSQALKKYSETGIKPTSIAGNQIQNP